MQDIVEPLKELNAAMVAITPQIAEKSMEMVRKHKLTFDMLSDPGMAYLTQLRIKFRIADEVIKIYDGFGIDVPAANGDDSYNLPMPTRLVVSQDGIVRAADIDPNHTVRPEPQKTLDDVKALG